MTELTGSQEELHTSGKVLGRDQLRICAFADG
jgi:hypothetical protein